MKLRTVRAKLLALVLLTTGTALLFAIGGIAAYDLRAYRTNAIADITAEAELLGQASAAALTFDDQAVARENLELLRQRPGLQAAALYGARGKLYASFSRGAGHAFPPLPGADGATVSGNQLTVFRRIVENGEIVGTVYVSADYLLARRLAGYLAIGLAVGAAALLLAYGVSLRLQSLVTGPLLEVAGVAQQVSEKRDFSLRARKLSEDEVGRLVDVFNGMLAEIESMTRGLHSEVAERARAEGEIRRLAEELESRVKERTAQLEYTNAELEAFCYSVSHDLRAPLRAVDGFSQALLEDFAKEVPEDAQRYLNRIRAATQRMGQLIEDLLNLSRVSRAPIERREVDVSAVARKVVADLQVRDPARAVEVHVWDGMRADADPRLLQAAFENLVGNAWKFTVKRELPRIEVGSMRDGPRTVFFVRDNGAGFDMAYADKLFGAFQRLHAATEFPGTGIGLATVQRIVSRHGGRIWADAQPDKGAAFFFTLDAAMEAAA